MKKILDGKYGEAVWYLAALVPILAFAVYIEAISWIGLGAMLAAATTIGGAYVVMSGLFAHGARAFRLSGEPAKAFWGGCAATVAGIAMLLYLEAYDTLVIGGMGLVLVCVLLAILRGRSAGGA